jgi:hypothetical protein
VVCRTNVRNQVKGNREVTKAGSFQSELPLSWPNKRERARRKSQRASRSPFSSHLIKSSSILYQHHSHQTASRAGLSIPHSVFTLYFTAFVPCLSLQASRRPSTKLVLELSIDRLFKVCTNVTRVCIFRHCRCLRGW